MLRFIVRRFLFMLLTIFIVSVVVFVITEAAPGNVARNVLGVHITPEQEASFLAQNGLDRPLVERYLYWLLGSDWIASRRVGFPLREVTGSGGREWWAVDQDGTLVRWKLEGDNLVVQRRQPDGTVVEEPDNGRWRIEDPKAEARRLAAYRAEVANNSNLTAADRRLILQHLDRILEALQREYSSPEALEAALAEPEAALEALMDPQADEQQELLRQGVNQFLQSAIVQSIVTTQELADQPPGDLEADQLATLRRRLGSVAAAVEDVDPNVAAQLRQAIEWLRTEDVSAARSVLAETAPQLEQLTGGLIPTAQALEAGNYQQAASALRALASSTASFDATRSRLLFDLLRRLGSNLEAANSELGATLQAGADAFQAGDAEAAAEALNRAAEVLEQAGHSITRTEVARRARVRRVFWGVDTQNHAVKWVRGTDRVVWVFIVGTGWRAFSGGPVEYIPLQRGLLRGDPGLSLRTGRPVADLLFPRLRNSLVLAAIVFVMGMPLAVVLGILAGLQEGRLTDRLLSVGGMVFSVTPEFAMGIFLILIFAFWLKWVPGATVFGEEAPWSRPDMLVLPVLTLMLIEVGYVLRITRASMVEVMKAPYIRTAFLKGLPYWYVVTKHAVRNALIAPITVILLHVNWLLGGIVVVEVIFGYPGLGSYLLESVLFKDFNAIEAGTVFLVAIAVSTQLVADILYTFLNPRIRYT